MPTYSATVGSMKQGRVVHFNETRFKILKHNFEEGTSLLRCCETNQQKGYGEGVLVSADIKARITFFSDE